MFVDAIVEGEHRKRLRDIRTHLQDSDFEKVKVNLALWRKWTYSEGTFLEDFYFMATLPESQIDFEKLYDLPYLTHFIFRGYPHSIYISLWFMGELANYESHSGGKNQYRRLFLGASTHEIPDNFKNLVHLEELIIVGMGFSEEVPLGLFDLKGLQSLTMERCGLTSTPKLYGFDILEELCLRDNKIINIYHNDFNMLSGLKHLDLSDNIFSCFSHPPIQSLKTLNLKGNDIRNVPNLSGFSSLLELNLLGNKIAKIGDEILEVGETLLRLYIGDNEITEIRDLYCMAKLQKIHAPRNKVKTLNPMPEHLTYLDMSHNQIEEVPPHICLSDSLDALFLNNNNISVIAQQIGDLKDLTFLDISANLIHRFPQTLSNCEKLETLNAGFNSNLANITGVFGCTALKVLRLTHAKIGALEHGVRGLKSLKEIYLSDTPLEYLSSSLFDLENLTTVYIERCGLTPAHLPIVWDHKIQVFL